VDLAERWARENRINVLHARRATEVALALAKGHRRRLRQGRTASPPYVRTPFLLATAKTLHLDPETGKLRLSLRFGERCSFLVPLADYHRRVLADPNVAAREVVVKPDRVMVVVEKGVPGPFVPDALIALDTNETSLDGVRVGPEGTSAVIVPFPEVRVVRQRHFDRRRRLARKKAHDRRVGSRLLRREARRERHRVVQRLHRVSKRRVETALDHRAALALERLEHLPVPRGRSPWSRRRLSAWPRRELHRQIFYKAEERGVPVFLVNPRFTSRTCPSCGGIQQRRSRVGTRFVCDGCGWSLDR
jgi:putative transposase